MQTEKYEGQVQGALFSSLIESPFLILPASTYCFKSSTICNFLSEIDSENNINMNMRDPLGSTPTYAFRVLKIYSLNSTGIDLKVHLTCLFST